MRSIAPPVLLAPPTGVRIRTRLWVAVADERVLRTVGEYLGRLAGTDVATRCRLGCGSVRRADRKRALTAASSSRWAGALTRTSNDQWQRGWRNLHDARANLRRAIRAIDRRLAAPVGGRRGRVRGYASGAEHWQKQRRRQVLATRLARVEAASRKGGSVSSAAAAERSGPVSIWRTPGSPRPHGGCDGMPSAGSSVRMGSLTRAGETRPSGFIPMRAGWS